MSVENKIRWQYLVSDYISTSIAVFIFNIIRFYELETPPQFNLVQFLLSENLILCQSLFPVGMMLFYYLSGYYNNMFSKSRTDEFVSTLTTAIAGTLVFILAILINDLTLDKTRDYTLFFNLLALLFTFVYVPRLLITSSVRKKTKRGQFVVPTVVVGYSSIPQRFPRLLELISKDKRLNVVSLVDWENKAQFCVSGTELPIYNVDEISKIVEQYGAGSIVVVPHPQGWEHTINVINLLLSLDLPIYVMADELPVYLFNTRMLSLTGTPFIDITHTHLPESTESIKRAFDITISLLTIAVLAIPMLFVALAVKLDSKGPVFYRQRRLGLHKKPFEILKIRTMVHDAEKGSGPQLSYEGDNRVTKVGHFLRKYRIDELPQFYNVLMGHMSIVGPRPERPHYTSQIIARDPAYTLLYRVRPGITSLGMVKFGYAQNVDEMLRRMRYDLIYLENMSISTDMKIILYTVRTVITGKGM